MVAEAEKDLVHQEELTERNAGKETMERKEGSNSPQIKDSKAQSQETGGRGRNPVTRGVVGIPFIKRRI